MHALPTARLLVLLAFPALAHAQTRYAITNLGNLGSSNTVPNSINAAGTVVGTDGSAFGAAQPFIFSGGTITQLPSLNGRTNEAFGINASGTIVGTSSTPASNLSNGFIISGGAVTDLGSNTSAVAINDAGTVTGLSANRPYIRSASGVVTILPTLAGTSFSTVTGITASGTVVGYADTAGGRRPFTATAGGATNLGALPGGSNSYAFGINAAGVAVGSSNEATNRQLHAVIYSGGTVTDIDPTGTASQASGINSAGTVVGTNSANRAFVYTAATGLVDLNTVVTNLAAAGFATLVEATAINDAG